MSEKINMIRQKLGWHVSPRNIERWKPFCSAPC